MIYHILEEEKTETKNGTEIRIVYRIYNNEFKRISTIRSYATSYEVEEFQDKKLKWLYINIGELSNAINIFLWHIVPVTEEEEKKLKYYEEVGQEDIKIVEIFKTE